MNITEKALEREIEWAIKQGWLRLQTCSAGRLLRSLYSALPVMHRQIEELKKAQKK